MRRRRLIAACFTGALACAGALVLLGCDPTFDAPAYTRSRDTVTLTVVDSAMLPDGIQGRAMWDSTKHCVIELRRYPAYLGHEVRHCLEGRWHGDVANGEDF